MISYQQLNEQNHQIVELSNVLSYLFQDRSMCDTETSCNLFYRYIQTVNDHMDLVDNNLYKDLLAHPENDIKNTARKFMSGGQEIRHILNRYEKTWCRKRKQQILVGGRHEEFLKETNEMFGLILDRIQREIEHLYPLIRQIGGNSRHAAWAAGKVALIIDAAALEFSTGELIEVRVLSIKGIQVKLGTDAPPDIPTVREELLAAEEQ